MKMEAWKRGSCCSATHLHPALLWPPRLKLAGALCPCDFPGKDTGVGCHFLLQEILPMQGSNPHLLHWQVDSLRLSYQGRGTRESDLHLKAWAEDKGKPWKWCLPTHLPPPDWQQWQVLPAASLKVQDRGLSSGCPGRPVAVEKGHHQEFAALGGRIINYDPVHKFVKPSANWKIKGKKNVIKDPEI